ncbi:ferredoxin [Thermodesulforhabdus norvegica]|uniref:Ferredoxin n=1 Tax=Thermodesulforhabdus norvegica TaxID=39841 RepID=A0A1I4S395_9BACT|nr:ferredoxin [Thermodesulforhabdus norvegica]SFM58871.1 ferredoxin [Thermodesulforhabdus norvegica]
MSRRLYLDEDCCVGCGTCAELCPEVFEMDEENEKARLVKPEGGDEDCIEEAIASCPEECIGWEE